MKKTINVTLIILIVSTIILIIIPASRDEIHWHWTALRNKTKNYKSYAKSWPEGHHTATAVKKLELIEDNTWKAAIMNDTIDKYNNYLIEFPEGKHVKEAEARIQIIEFNSAFKIAERFTDEQVKTYMNKLENEFYSTVLDEPLVYYNIEGNCRDKITKRRLVVKPSPYQKVCSLELEAENFSITAVYISNSSISRPLFPKKWDYTMSHNGRAGPGLEFKFFKREIKKLLDTYSIVYRPIHYAYGNGDAGYVVPDLLWGSDWEGSRAYPHKGHEFKLKPESYMFVYKVDGVEGMPDKPITSYKEALVLKTYLKVLGKK